MKEFLLKRTGLSIALVLLTLFTYNVVHVLIIGNKSAQVYKDLLIEGTKVDTEIEKIMEEYKKW